MKFRHFAILAILLCFLSVVGRAQTCQVRGNVQKPDLLSGTGTVPAPDVTVTVVKVLKSGLLLRALPMTTRTDSNGDFALNLPADSTAWINLPALGFGSAIGEPLAIPKADKCPAIITTLPRSTLTSLAPIILVQGGGGGGSGTVTSFGAGNLSPLFTTSVANATTTPTLSFSLTAQNSNLFFAGPASGAAAAPTFRLLTVGDIPDLSSLYAALSHTHTFASLTGKPSTLAGYGITDAYPLSGNPANFLTANQSIALSGDISGSGTTAITTVIGVGKVVNAMLAGSIADSKLLTISTAGKVADSALSANVTLLGNTTTGVNALVRATSPTITNPVFQQNADGDDAVTVRRFTDTSPTGNFVRYRNAANSADLWRVDVTGSLAAGGVPMGRITGIPNCTNSATDKLLYNSGTGVFSCGSDQTGAGGSGIATLNGLTPTTQTFSRTNDTNLTLTITSATADHNFALGWLGQLSIARGGTGANTAAGAFDALSPMTTLGDVIYGGVSGTRTRLAGNTSTSRRFLRQTGDGTNSAAPAWDALVAGDIPDLSSLYAALSHTHTFASLTSKPTTLAGYGITDAYPLSGNPSNFLTANQTITLSGDQYRQWRNCYHDDYRFNNEVTNAMLAQMAAHTFKGNNTGATANTTDLTATQLTAELNAMVGDTGSGGTKGLVPAPAAGDSTKCLSGAGTYITCSGGGSGGTVTNTGGALTANAVVLGAGSNDAKVVAGITTDGASKLGLGVAGTAVGKVEFFNATSGSIILQPVAGALGSTVMVIPAISSTFACLACIQNFTANQTFSAAVDASSATSFKIPSSAGYAPITAALIGFDSTAGKLVVGNGSTTLVLASEAYVSGNYVPTSRTIAGNALSSNITLDAIDNGIAANGLIVRTTANTRAARTITGTGNQVTVINGNGVGGDPTLSLPQDIATTSNVRFANLGLGVAAPTSGGQIAMQLGVNNIDGLAIQRFTNTTPTGNFFNFKDASGTTVARMGVDGTLLMAAKTQQIQWADANTVIVGDDGSDYMRFGKYGSGWRWRDMNNSVDRMQLGVGGLLTVNGQTAVNTGGNLAAFFVGTVAPTTGDTSSQTYAGVLIKPTINSASGVTSKTLDVLQIDTTNSVTTGFAVNLIDAMYGGVSKFTVDSTGAMTAGSVPIARLTGLGTSVAAALGNAANGAGGFDVVDGVATLVNKTLTAPKIVNAGFIADANGNELMIFNTTASAVNEVTFANAATGNNPAFTASGGDANIGITFTPKAPARSTMGGPLATARTISR
ncbi:MAG: hypothetical protein U0Y68_18455 [Blastocatellia bacterium]